MQNKYGKSGNFTVFLSNVQANDSKTKEVLDAAGVNFPVYDQVRLKQAPVQGGIPHAALFDHKGKLVASGHPSQLFSQVEALVKAIHRPPSPTPMLDGIGSRHWRKQVDKLRNGSPIQQSLNFFDRRTKERGEAGEEAKAIAAGLREWIAAEQDRYRKTADKFPSYVASELDGFCKQLARMPERAEMKKLQDELLAKKAVKNLVKIRKEYDKARASKRGRGKAIGKVRKKLDKFIGTVEGDDVVLAEAKALRELM